MKNWIDKFLEVSRDYFLKTDAEMQKELTKSKILDILLIEDDDFIIEVVTELINDLHPDLNINVRLTIAKNMTDILKILGEHKHFDYVLLDGYLENNDNTQNISREISDKYFTISTSNDANMQNEHMKNWTHLKIDKLNIYKFLNDLIHWN